MWRVFLIAPDKTKNNMYSTPMTRKKSNAPALEKGMRILEILASVHEPINMTQIAKNLEVSVSSIQRILGELVQKGYIGKTPTNGYYLTDRFYKLAAARESEESLLYHSMDAMHEYVNNTTESVHLSIARAGQYVVIGQINGIDLVRVSIREGSYPILDYPSGWVLLAWNAKEAYVGNKIPPDKKEIIKKVRKNGYGFKESKIRSAIYHLGVPILGSNGNALGALTTSFAGWKDKNIEETKQYILKYLRQAADKIEKKIAP